MWGIFQNLTYIVLYIFEYYLFDLLAVSCLAISHLFVIYVFHLCVLLIGSLFLKILVLGLQAFQRWEMHPKAFILCLSCPFTGMLLGNSRVIVVAAKQKQDNINNMSEGTSPCLARRGVKEDIIMFTAIALRNRPFP